MPAPPRPTSRSTTKRSPSCLRSVMGAMDTVGGNRLVRADARVDPRARLRRSGDCSRRVGHSGSSSNVPRWIAPTAIALPLLLGSHALLRGNDSHGWQDNTLVPISAHAALGAAADAA